MFRIISLPILVVCLAAGSFADTVTLSNGEKLTGKIISKTDTEVTMSVQISAGISDERVIKKSDILKMVEDTPDALAWAKLKDIKLGKSSFPAASYDAAITSLKAFVTQYPKSPFAAEAQKAAVRDNKLESAYLRPMAFYGAEAMGIAAKTLSTHVIVAAWTWGAYMGDEAIEKGIRAKTSSSGVSNSTMSRPEPARAARYGKSTRRTPSAE